MLFLRARFIHDLHAVKLRVRKLAVRCLSVAGAELLNEGRIYLYFNALHVDPLGFIPPLPASFQAHADAAICLTMSSAFALQQESRR